MSNLVTTSKRFLEWAQSLPHIVIPAGLESDMQEAIAQEEAAEQLGAGDGLHSCLCGDRIQLDEYRCSNCRAWETTRAVSSG